MAEGWLIGVHFHSPLWQQKFEALVNYWRTPGFRHQTSSQLSEARDSLSWGYKMALRKWVRARESEVLVRATPCGTGPTKHEVSCTTNGAIRCWSSLQVLVRGAYRCDRRQQREAGGYGSAQVLSAAVLILKIFFILFSSRLNRRQLLNGSKGENVIVIIFVTMPAEA